MSTGTANPTPALALLDEVQRLPAEKLPTANALVEGATFIAILTGTIAGGMAAHQGGPRAFGLRGSNFFIRPGSDGDRGWEADLALLKGWHERLLDAVGEFAPARLGERIGSNDYSFQDLILGAASHDLYHAGQIQLLKRLRDESVGR